MTSASSSFKMSKYVVHEPLFLNGPSALVPRVKAKPCTDIRQVSELT